MLAIVMVAAIATANPLQARLPVGLYAPDAGATCRGSSSALGTSNTASARGVADTVVNIWQIERVASGATLGWIVRTHDGRLWYEDPVPFEYQEIRRNNAGIFLGPGLKYNACFKADLRLRSK